MTKRNPKIEAAPDVPETTGDEREGVGKGRPPVEHQFKPGNPGRPKGSRNKLGEAFVEALHDDFMVHGPEAIVKVRLEKPDQYLKVVASLLPKELKIETTSDLTDEQLDTRLRDIAAALGLEIGTGGAAVGEAPTPISKTAH